MNETYFQDSMAVPVLSDTFFFYIIYVVLRFTVHGANVRNYVLSDSSGKNYSVTAIMYFSNNFDLD